MLRTLPEKFRGLVLVTGPKGSDKSTTLGAMVDYINRNAKGHILTIEDPIEFVYLKHQLFGQLAGSIETYAGHK